MLLTDPDARFVVGHRGAPAEAPENTLAGFELALARGARALELDVHLSADGVPVVIHDPDTIRVTGRMHDVAALATPALAALDAGHAWSRDGREFPWRERGATIPTLAQVLEATDVPLIIELKCVAAALPVRDLLGRVGAGGRVLVGGFDEAALAPFLGSGIAVAGGRSLIGRLWRRSALGLPVHEVGAPALAVPLRWRGLRVPGRRLLRAARRAGTAVHVWTVDDPGEARRLWADGASGIVTNDPAALAAVTPPAAAGSAAA